MLISDQKTYPAVDNGWGEIRTLDHLCVRQVS
jgi:hypothetical protein